VRAAAGIGGTWVDGDDVWWSELRPEEAGRVVLVRSRADGTTEDVLPAPWSARTRAHEYGGGAWWVRDGVAWFTEWSDQRLHRLVPGEQPVAVTAAPEQPHGDRWADGRIERDGTIVCVREHHPAAGGEAVNEIVRVDDATGDVAVVASGADFVSDPRPSPDGSSLCWLEWDHPNMPWDGTRLMVDGAQVAGGPDESINQPVWSPDGVLHLTSDRTGWWNLYRLVDGLVEPVVLMEAEIGGPQWVFNQSRYAFLDDGRIAFAYSSDGLQHLAVADREGEVREVDVPYTVVGEVRAQGARVVFVGASPTAEPAVVRVDVDSGAIELLRPPRDLGLDAGYISEPRSISFPSAGGRTAHALHYPPTSAAFEGPPGEAPPLIVEIHGGPTSAARPMLQVGIQYWTSRGFAVVDVNYGGSVGYGRPYRDLLKDSWGIVDVEDCEAAARWLAEQGLADPARLAITGGSAGGYTTLEALCQTDTFSAGASHFGVADLEALATETHKFESRYLDGLIGPYPERRDLYIERSPIHHTDRLTAPLIVFQGLEDEVVPPNQAEMIVSAVRDKGVPVAYVAFEGEQHGFRQAPNIRRALDGELSFYAQVWGFELSPDEGIEPVEVDNLAAARRA
jgi:dipeptidyl aminopeptidase/acylaminoacyl peptidase